MLYSKYYLSSTQTLWITGTIKILIDMHEMQLFMTNIVLIYTFIVEIFL